jgi:hypothetical protein
MFGEEWGGPGRTYTAILNKKFCISHPFSYPNIIAVLKVDFTPGYDPTHRL